VSPAVSLLVEHGYVVLFVYVLVSQLGAPLPSGPLIMAAGALSATGRIGFGATLAIVVAASLCADTFWYQLGRARGGRVVRFLCRVSLEPEACVRRTRDSFGRYGAPFLLVAKFVPGVGLMAAPVAGQANMRYGLFLALGSAGALLWASTYAAIGRFLGEWIERNAELLQAAARFGLVALLCAAAAVLVWRLLRRRAFRRLLATDRITPVELKGRMDRGETFYVVDLRHPTALGNERHSLPGAVQLRPDDVIAHTADIPKDREIVLFCDCPGEASAALVALTLQRSGFARARPLEGGLDGWKHAGYPIERLAESAASS
jgi:membrane protein DedA with SNARE-associated domain/rhodanese-related sulfurtransferase